MLQEHMQDEVILVRDGKETKATVYVQGRTVFAPFGIDARVGDLFHWSGFTEDHVVSKVEPLRAPASMCQDMNHTEIAVVPIHEWREVQRHKGAVAITQNFGDIGTVGAIAGRDVTGPVTVSAVQMLEALEKEIVAAPSIPPEEKKGLLEKVKGLIFNPYVKALGTTAITECVKGWFSLGH